MDNKIAAIKEQFLSELSKAENSADLEAMRVAYLGKKGFVTELMKEMKDLSVEEKKAFGQKVNVIKGEVTDKLAEKNQELSVSVKTSSSQWALLLKTMLKSYQTMSASRLLIFPSITPQEICRTPTISITDSFSRATHQLLRMLSIKSIRMHL